MSEHSEIIPLVDVYGLLRKAIRAAGSQHAFAQRLGVTDSYVSAVLLAKKPIPASMLTLLGLRREVRFVRVRA